MLLGRARWALAVWVICVLLVPPGAARADPAWSAPVFLDGEGTRALTGVACPSSSQCTAVDVSGQEVTFEPASPGGAVAHTLEPAGLPVGGAGVGYIKISVACPSRSQCTAVDGRGGEVTFDPLAPGFPVVHAVDTAGLNGVACASASQCTAVDASGREVTFDPLARGTEAPVAIDSVGLRGVACPSSSQCSALDASGRVVTFDPASPNTPTSQVVAGSGGAWLSVACPSIAQCTAVDGSGEEATFDPRAPGSAAGMRIDTAGFSSVACPSTSQCTAVDSASREVTFDPTSPGRPTPVGPLGTGPGTESVIVACPSPAQCTGVDLTGEEATFDPTSPGRPRPVQMYTGASLVRVACPTRSLCVAVGLEPFLFRPQLLDEVAFNPSSPQKPSVHRVSYNPPTALACPSRTECVAFDSSGAEITFNPTDPGTLPSSPNRQSIRPPSLGVACPSATQCIAVNDEGQEVTFDPLRTALPAARAIDSARSQHGTLTAVACPAVSQCTAVDTGGREVTFNPRSPSRRTNYQIDTTGLSALACPSTRRCIAVDTAGRAVTFNPRIPRVRRIHTIDTGGLTSVACPSTSVCVAVDSSGNAIDGDPTFATAWKVDRIAGANSLSSVACKSASQCVTVDVTGRAFEATRILARVAHSNDARRHMPGLDRERIDSDIQVTETIDGRGRYETPSRIHRRWDSVRHS